MFFIETLVIAPCCGEETVHVKIALLHWEGWEGGGQLGGCHQGLDSGGEGLEFCMLERELCYN